MVDDFSFLIKTWKHPFSYEIDSYSIVEVIGKKIICIPQ